MDKISKLYGTVFKPSVWREVTVDTLALGDGDARYRVTVWGRGSAGTRLVPRYCLTYLTSKAAWRAARSCYFGDIHPLFTRVDEVLASMIEQRNCVVRRRYYGGEQAKAKRDQIAIARGDGS